MRALVVALAIVLGFGRADAAFTPPKLDGQVVDLSKTMGSTWGVNKALDDIRTRTGFVIAALVVKSLDGETIDDVAYKTFNTWKLGEAGKDNGVLIVIALDDHRMRIETGKGVTGSLTDLQADDVILAVRPLLQAGQTDQAITLAADRITMALQKDAKPLVKKVTNPAETRRTTTMVFVIVGIVVVGLIILCVVSPKARAILGPLWWVLSGILQLFSFFGGRGGGGGGSSGYKGGGGTSGGGGASDSF